MPNDPADRAPRADDHRNRAISAQHFTDPAVVARYAEGPRRSVPGLTVLHQLVDQLLAETVPAGGRVLVVGAGGGLELTHLAERHDGWSFDGVDPSAEMLQLARSTMGPLADHAALHHGYVEDAPEGPFDAATCLLTLHFLAAEERLRTLQEIRARLKPGTPLLTFHHSVAGGGARTTWLERHARFAAGPDPDAERVAATVSGMSTQLPLLTPAEDEELLRAAGFTGIWTYYAALTFRGWLAYA